MTEAQAVETAEKFISANGYTNLPPDRENLADETVEPQSNADEKLKMRHDSLKPKAFSIARGRKSETDG